MRAPGSVSLSGCGGGLRGGDRSGREGYRWPVGRCGVLRRTSWRRGGRPPRPTRRPHATQRTRLPQRRRRRLRRLDLLPLMVPLLPKAHVLSMLLKREGSRKPIGHAEGLIVVHENIGRRRVRQVRGPGSDKLIRDVVVAVGVLPSKSLARLAPEDAVEGRRDVQHVEKQQTGMTALVVRVQLHMRRAKRLAAAEAGEPRGPAAAPVAMLEGVLVGPCVQRAGVHIRGIGVGVRGDARLVAAARAVVIRVVGQHVGAPCVAVILLFHVDD